MIEALGALRGKKVLVTGHTGFKGGWLCLWLERLGAEVYGYALPPVTSPSLFELCQLQETVNHQFGDIRDMDQMIARVAKVQPDVVFHLAAQPIVRESYLDPVGTFASNVMGTVHVLEAVRVLDRPCAVVVVSSDKCYDNREWVWGYRENDPLGGKDPYSASKGATELVVTSWRHSFFGVGSHVRLASGRAGNVIGGGDWAADRIIPDCVRAFQGSGTIELRNPTATRPWQHVLEPLGGYLLLASRLLGEDGDAYCSAWNFGPSREDVCGVETVVGKFSRSWGAEGRWSKSAGPHPPEAAALSLNCDKAIGVLGWRPTWSLDQMLGMTAEWYLAWQSQKHDMRALTLQQIDRFESDYRSAASA